MTSPLLLAVMMMGAFLNPASAGQYPRLDERLRSAAERGNIELVRVLLARGADVNAADDDGKTALYGAADGGHAEIVKLLLEHHADAKAKTKKGKTVLYAACAFKQPPVTESVKAILDAGADVNMVDGSGLTPLMHTVWYAKGDLDLLKAVLDHGAKVDWRYETGQTPLDFVGNAAQAKLLVDRGADVNAKDNNGRTPLMTAKKDVAAFLLDHGADVNASDKKGFTALIYSAGKPDMVRLLLDRGARKDDTLFAAVSAGDRDAVKRLVAKGARVNERLPNGETPLMFAAKAGDIGIVGDLLAAGAKADAKTKDKSETALFWAADGPIAEALIARGAEIDGKDAYGRTPLFGARADKAEVLLTCGAKVDTAEKDGKTALIAATLGHEADADKAAAVKVLLTHHADADKAYNSSNYNALFWALYSDDKDTARLLLEHGVSAATFDRAALECKDAGVARVLLGRWTGTIKKGALLGKAAGEGNIDMAKALLDGGVDIEESDTYGDSALLQAARNGRAEMVKFLLSRGANADFLSGRFERPLTVAAAYGHIDVLKALLEHDARPEAKDRALGKALESDRFAAVRLLLENGADPEGPAAAYGGSGALAQSAYEGKAEFVEMLLAAGANPLIPTDLVCNHDKDDRSCPKDRILAALSQTRARPVARKEAFTAGDSGLDFWLPKKEEARLAAGKLIWGARKQPKPASSLVSESKTVWQNLSAVAAKLIADDVDRFVGRTKPDAPTLVQDQYESRSQFEAKVAAAKSKYANDLRAYREKVSSYPVWRRNAILEAALDSVLGAPGIAAKRQYDADSQTFAPEIVSEGGFKQAFILTQTIPNDKAADFDKALQGAKMKAFFQLKGTGVSATAAEFQVLGTTYQALPAQGSIAGEQKLAKVDLGDAAPAGPESLRVDYADNPELAQKVAELEKLKRKRSQKDELTTLEAQIAQLKKGEERVFHSDVDEPAFAPKAGRPHDLALVVGIESYQDQDLPKADFAERDAQAMAKYLAALGVPKENIKLLKGQAATAGKIKGYLGSWLAKNVKPDSRVFFYFSGHGAPEPESRDAYLVSWDGDPQFLKTTAVSLTSVYEDLGKLKAKQVLVAMDSCFSGTGGRSVIKKGSRPLVNLQEAPAPAQITVLAAASKDEIAGSFEEQGHGTFTYYLLKGLGAGSHDSRSLFDYLKPKVQDKAAHGNATQVPVYQGPDFAF